MRRTSSQNPASIARPADFTRSDEGYIGKPGDFLVKNFRDCETAYPADVWIVDQTLFRQTYEAVAPGE